MSKAKWTPAQLAAITTRDCNLLVAAAAGAGKTAVLVERLIQQITDQAAPVDVDRLLVVTFTKAAAAEMRERIGQALARELSQHPGSRHLHRQLNLLNKAAITTLHSFCLEVLKQYFYRIDLDPGFRVADETEAELLRLEAVEELFEEQYTLESSAFLQLVDAYGGNRDDTLLQEMVLKLASFANSNPWPALWLQQMAAAYCPADDLGLDALNWTASILQDLELQLQSAQDKLARALRLASQPGGPEDYQATLEADQVEISSLQKAVGSWESLYQAFQHFGFTKLATCRDKAVDPELKERVQSLRNDVKKQVNNLQEEFFSRQPAELLADLRQLAPLAAALAELVQEYNQRYQQLKQAKGLIDFTDLEHYCLAILLEPGSTPEQIQPSAVALELQQQYQEVLVDEYQDTNAVQEAILCLVSRQASAQPNLFMVGDVKQSIYRFRLADPGLFLAKYQAFPREVGQPSRGIDLACNFRSRAGIVDGVNFLFRQLMTPRVGEISYDAQAELVCGAAYLQGIADLATAEGPTELYILEKLPAEPGALGEAAAGEELAVPDLAAAELNSAELASAEPTEPGDLAGPQNELEQEEELDATQREARVVAKRIQQMVQGQGQNGAEFLVLDKASGTYRPVSYHDIVILMRATKGTANTFLEELRQAGIPAYADLGTGYFQATEIETMLALLKVIDNPRQDIPLAAVLRSPLVGLTAEELAQIRLTAPGGDFFTAFHKAAETGHFAQLEQFAQDLASWRTMARRGSLADLIWRLYMETGYYAYVGTLAGGVQRQANLRALHDRARQYEATSFRGLFRFLRFIEKFQEGGNDLGTARALGENEDVVRIISIHKSKGLEFPVVFVTGLGKQFNTLDLKQTILLHKELGMGLPVVETELRYSYPSLAQQAIKKRLQLELLAEELRILYVALTRPRERLILVGSVRDTVKQASRWCESITQTGWALPDPQLAAAKCFLDWLAPAVARHQEGEVLRQAAGQTMLPQAPEVCRDPSQWKVHLLPAEACNSLPTPAPAQAQSELPPKLWERLAALEPLPEAPTYDLARLEWQYAWQTVTATPAKATVTELKKRFSEQQAAVSEETSIELSLPAELLGSAESTNQDAPTGQVVPASQALSANQRRPKLNSRPRFLQEKTGLSAAEKGSAMHLVMQYVHLAGDLSPAGLQEQVAGFVTQDLITPEQAGALDLPALSTFFTSPLGNRLGAALKVQRELPFTLALPAELVYPDLLQAAALGENPPSQSGEQVLVQGVIDCLLDEGDGLVLIDYKTDRIPTGGVAHLVANYQGQLNLYAHALEVMLKRPVKEKYLYFFAIGEAIKC